MKRLALLLVVALAGCDQPSEGEEAMAEMESAMRSQTQMVRDGVALQDIFEGRCTDDCSGHRAGYLWAIDATDVYDEDQCPTASQSFYEGCQMGVRAAAFE